MSDTEPKAELAPRRRHAPSLDGGLELRPAGPDDHEAIIRLSADAHGGHDGEIVRALIARPHDPGEWLVVVDGDRVVSTCTLLRQTLRVGPVELPVGQVEYVATEADYRRRGLVAAQFAEHHRRSAARGDLVNLVYGIPYFYRRLGYGYGLGASVRRPVRTRLPPSDDGFTVRSATTGDLEAIEVLDRAARAAADVAVLRSSEKWAWLRENCESWGAQVLVVERGGTVEGWARVQSWEAWDEKIAIIEEIGASSTAAAHAAMAAAVDRLPDVEMWVRDRPGTPVSAAVEAVTHESALYDAVYVRFGDPVAVVEALRPVLSARLKDSALNGETGALDISLFSAGIRLHYEPGEVVGVEAIPGEEDPLDDGNVGVAPDHLPALVLGRFDPRELERRHDDVSFGRFRELMTILFPQQTADVLDVI